MKPEQFLDILHTAERLKNNLRHCVTSSGRSESVAEHSWRLALMAFLLREEFPALDMARVIELCLIHDLGEAFTGDKPCIEKTDADTAQEVALYRAWVAALPAEIAARFRALIDEMEQRQTPEAQLYKALDRLEALIQHNEAPISSWLPLEYDLQKTYGHDSCAFDPWLTALRQAVLRDTIEKIDRERGEDG